MRIAALAASAIALAALAAGCASPDGQQVTGKHQCTRNGKPAYCLTVTGGHVVYVPRAVYVQARTGDDYDPGTVSVHAPAPADAHPVDPAPVEVHPVIVDAR